MRNWDYHRCLNQSLHSHRELTNTNITDITRMFVMIVSVLTVGHMAKSTQVSISHIRGFWAILTQACVSS